VYYVNNRQEFALMTNTCIVSSFLALDQNQFYLSASASLSYLSLKLKQMAFVNLYQNGVGLCLCIVKTLSSLLAQNLDPSFVMDQTTAYTIAIPIQH